MLFFVAISAFVVLGTDLRSCICKTNALPLELCPYSSFFFLAVLGFELRASHLLGVHQLSHSTSLFFLAGSYCTEQEANT
jgi:hypothetical protein